MSTDKKVLLVLRSTPYGSSLARSGIDAGLAAAAFEQSVSLLFLGAGVLQLVPGQNGRALGVRDLGKLLASLPLYDIDRIYADAAAAERFGVDLTTASVSVTPVDVTEMRDLLDASDTVLGF